MVVNVVEKDLRMVTTGDQGVVEVDAYPARYQRPHCPRRARISIRPPRTASIEIEIPNSNYRLKPGILRPHLADGRRRKNTLVAPKSAVIDFESKRGVWMPNEETRARFIPVELGIEGMTRRDPGGIKEERFVTTARPPCATTISSSSPARAAW
jgi:hypothetical protein